MARGRVRHNAHQRPIRSDSRLRRLEAERTEIADTLAVAHKAIDTLQLKEADAEAQVQQLRSQLEAISHEVQAAPSVLGEIQELKASNERKSLSRLRLSQQILTSLRNAFRLGGSM